MPEWEPINPKYLTKIYLSFFQKEYSKRGFDEKQTLRGRSRD
jgi:hypothetical protein